MIPYASTYSLGPPEECGRYLFGRERGKEETTGDQRGRTVKGAQNA